MLSKFKVIFFATLFLLGFFAYLFIMANCWVYIMHGYWIFIKIYN